MARKTDDDLRCRVCGELCPCDLYSGKEPHAHCPGGLDTYLLCDKHKRECLAVHRPIDANGKWQWIDCDDPGCGYCQAIARLRQGL